MILQQALLLSVNPHPAPAGDGPSVQLPFAPRFVLRFYTLPAEWIKIRSAAFLFTISKTGIFVLVKLFYCQFDRSNLLHRSRILGKISTNYNKTVYWQICAILLFLNWNKIDIGQLTVKMNKKWKKYCYVRNMAKAFHSGEII